jgi:WD40 repeat protein
MAIVDGCIHVGVWDLRTERLIRTVVLPTPASGSGVVTPDGRYLLVGVTGGGFVRADLHTGAIVQVPGEQAAVNVIASSPDGRFYAIGREDGTVDQYDARSLRLVRRHTVQNSIQTIAFSPDSQLLAIEDTATVVRVWDTCAMCENPAKLAARAASESVRALTPGERATFNVK